MRMQVQSLASLGGLRICCCCELWCRSQMWLGSSVALASDSSSDLTPALESSRCSGCGHKKKKTKVNFFFFKFFSFFKPAPPAPYGGSQARGSNWSCSCQPTALRIQAASVTYTMAHGNTRPLTHQARPGIEPASSWILVRFVSTEPWLEVTSFSLFGN